MNTSALQPVGVSAAEDVIIILPVRDLVLFPGVVLPIAIQGKRALAAAQEAVRTQRRVGLLLQKDPAIEDPEYRGTASSRHGGIHRAVHHSRRRHASLDLPG